MKKHYIWSNCDISVDDWRDGYAEFCEINNITPGDDNALLEWAYETNASYLDDERMNLDKRVDGDILVFGDIGLWNGRVNSYSILRDNLNAILDARDDVVEFYGDGREIRATGAHHDGVNFYHFRAIRPGRDINKLLDAFLTGEYISPQKLNYYTRSIYTDVAKIYGWEE